MMDALMEEFGFAEFEIRKKLERAQDLKKVRLFGEKRSVRECCEWRGVRNGKQDARLLSNSGDTFL